MNIHSTHVPCQPFVNLTDDRPTVSKHTLLFMKFEVFKLAKAWSFSHDEHIELKVLVII